MIQLIEETSRKEEIAAHILNQLPDWFGLPDSTKNYIQESKKMPFWAYYAEGQPVGFIVLRETGPYAAELYVMGILKEFHRRGIGTELWNAFVAYAMDKGYEYIQVKTVKKGHYKEYDITNSFYESLGFRELECLPLWDEWNPCQVYVKYIGGRGIMEKNVVPEKQKLSWIFFDVGSTLVDETEAYNHRIRDAISGTDITFEQFQEKRLFFAKQNLKGDLEALKFFGLEKTPWHKEDEVPYPEAKEILCYLKEKGYRLGVIANQSLGTAERLANWGLLNYIDVVAASAEFGVAKPDPAIFERAFRLAGCQAQEAVMVGDRLDNDIIPAKKLGMKAVWVKQGFAVYQDVKAAECKPDYEIENLMELKEIF